MTDAVNDPHPVEEDPEEHIGDVIQDPWVDPDQTDWPQADEVEMTPENEEAS